VIGTIYAADLDRYGLEFFGALVAASRRGVSVVIGIDRTAQLAYDVRAKRGTRKELYARIAELEREGGVVSWYGGLKSLLWRPGSGQHFKSLIGDGKEAILESRNVGHEYIERWMDFGVRLRGPIVGVIGKETLALLGRSDPYPQSISFGRRRGVQPYQRLLAQLDAQLVDQTQAAQRALAAKPRMRKGSLMLVAWDPPADEGTYFPSGGNRVTEALTHLVSNARREVVLSSNFAYPTKRLRQALIEAARRGVRVKIVTTGKQAAEVSLWPYWYTSAHYREFVDAGIEVYETTRMDHAKLYLIDGRLAAFGSYNASKMSDAYNADGLLFTRDRRLVRTVQRALTDTITNRAVRYVVPAPNTPRSVSQRFEDGLRSILRWF
jgi:phosphatidylserine/phosphatidylglycerophosphate/cardiolipin synthase-like enzyme